MSSAPLSELVDRIAVAGVVPVVEIDDPDRAVQLAAALSEGGLPIIEVTFRTPAAEQAIARIADALADVLLIAGTVTSAEQADRAAAAGAALLVSPGFSPSVVEHAATIGIAMMPGVCTASEVMSARSRGITNVKLFPIGPLGGVSYLRALAAPFPDMRWNPTGGVSPATLADYLRVRSVLACGGSWVAPRDDIAAGRFEAIRRRAAEASAIVRDARPAAPVLA